jgi:hypothetical protein
MFESPPRAIKEIFLVEDVEFPAEQLLECEDTGYSMIYLSLFEQNSLGT